MAKDMFVSHTPRDGQPQSVLAGEVWEGTTKACDLLVPKVLDGSHHQVDNVGACQSLEATCHRHRPVAPLHTTHECQPTGSLGVVPIYII